MQSHLKLATFLAKLLDSQFKLFGIRFGLDFLLGLIPGIGDFISFCLSSYIVWIGYQLKLPMHAIVRMIALVVFDFLIGTIPVLGDILDLGIKANLRNLETIEKYTSLK